MDIQLSKAEIRLFAKLMTQGERLSLEEVAKKGAIGLSQASRLVKSLEVKGFLISAAKGRKKVIVISKSAHSLALKELIESSPHIQFDQILENSTMRVLMGFSESGSSAEQIAQMTAIPTITVKRTIGKLLLKGTALQPKRGTYLLSLPAIWKFLDAYRLFAAEEIRKGISGSLIVRGGCGILRTSQGNLPANFIKTGISSFRDIGVPITRTDFQDYYFTIFGNATKPSMEEKLVHAILRTTLFSSSREISYVLLAMKKNLKKLKEAKFLEAARSLGAEGAAEECLKYLENLGKPDAERLMVKLPLHPSGFAKVEGPIFPSKEEFLDLVKQYG